MSSNTNNRESLKCIATTNIIESCIATRRSQGTQDLAQMAGEEERIIQSKVLFPVCTDGDRYHMGPLSDANLSEGLHMQSSILQWFPEWSGCSQKPCPVFLPTLQ